jgi:hypothetical protein
MAATLFACSGGRLTLPDAHNLLVSRENGGNLVVLPPRPVWERSELDASELASWGKLVAAAGRAMLEVLPQLRDGCINYWEAGNWALNDAAEPAGPKRAPEYRSVHLHLLGRSRQSTSPDWRWGESPRFPAFAERHAWGQGFEPLNASECQGIVKHTEASLRSRYAMPAAEILPWAVCAPCGYPTAASTAEGRCEACRRR